MMQRALPQCGAIGQGDGSVCWRVWAPRARKVELVLIDGERRQHVVMSAEDGGCFTYTQANIEEGQRYAYRLDGGPERPDPVSDWQSDGVHRASSGLRPERFAWK